MAYNEMPMNKQLFLRNNVAIIMTFLVGILIIRMTCRSISNLRTGPYHCKLKYLNTYIVFISFCKIFLFEGQWISLPL